MKNTYRISKGVLHLKFKYDENKVKEIKQIFENPSFNSALKEWNLPISVKNSKQINRFIKKHSFVKNNDIDKVILGDINIEDNINNHKEVQKTFNSLVKYTNEYDENIGLKPRPYQTLPIDYMLNKKKVMLSDDMGVGKTPETIMTVELGQLYPLLLVTPSSVKYHWKELFKIANPNRKVQVLKSAKDKVDFSCDVFILTYGILGKKVKIEGKNGEYYVAEIKIPDLLKIDWTCFVADESHALKSPKSSRTMSVKKLVKGVEYRFLLSGTQVENRPKELIAPLQILGVFKDFGNWDGFVHRYCDAKKNAYGKWDIDGASNMLELNLKLRKNCYIRREQWEVLKDLPEMQNTVINIDLSNNREYLKAEKDFINFLNEKGDFIKADKAIGKEYLSKKNTLRQLSIKGKIKDIEDWIDNFLESSDEKLVVFGLYREPLIELSNKYKGHLINGDVDSEKKAEIISKFKKDNVRILFGNMMSVGTGTDGLQDVCKNMAIIELPEKPSIIEQTKARLRRSGQKHMTNCFMFLCRKSIDAAMWLDIQKKAKISDAANKGVVNEIDELDTIIKYYKNE